MSSLTDEQWELFYALRGAIVTRRQASEMLQKGSGDNLEEMFLLNKERFTSYATITTILARAKGQNILKEVLTTSKDGFSPVWLGYTSW